MFRLRIKKKKELNNADLIGMYIIKNQNYIDRKFSGIFKIIGEDYLIYSEDGVSIKKIPYDIETVKRLLKKDYVLISKYDKLMPLVLRGYRV